jgi:hypothetical protein
MAVRCSGDAAIESAHAAALATATVDSTRLSREYAQNGATSRPR